MPKVVIVQPWFTAVGHPAQSILNTANALADSEDICYLVSEQTGSAEEPLKALRKTIKQVDTFKVSSTSLREGTLKALYKLCMQKKKHQGFIHVFFFDAHLVLLALFWSIFYPYLKPQRLSLIYLMGPERVLRSRVASYIVKKFLNRHEITLYLRTEELAGAWRAAFSQISSSTIRHLPSLELPSPIAPINAPDASDLLKFGILGQVRKGKGLEWLVPMFVRRQDIGQLTVAGTFNNQSDAESMRFMHDFSGFNNAYLADDKMVQIANEQHYLLMLYDDWDARMESAVLYLAARAGRPVVAFANGWCGRQIRQYGNGIIAADDPSELESLIRSLPHPGEQGYYELLLGVERFRQAHSITALKEQYLNELTRNVPR